LTTVFRTVRSRTLEASYSFYVPQSHPSLIQSTAALVGAVTVRGSDGPRQARRALGSGWGGALLFDSAAYERRGSAVDESNWFAAQEAAGADRLLTPGEWVEWSRDSDALAEAVESQWRAGSIAPGATLLLALDSRWLGRDALRTIATLEGVDAPLALVLGHREDPLSANGVMDSLLELLRSVPSVSLLRSDHGAVGALAFGAVHGAIGLRPAYRHFVPPTSSGGGKRNDWTPRLFVWDLMDWFTAGTIAGWTASHIRLDCTLECCQGAPLDRFFDPALDTDAVVHNATVLAKLADYIVGYEPIARRRAFAELCANAVANYGPMGKLSELIEPKAQLTKWAQWY
jgi:hypothetical protein